MNDNYVERLVGGLIDIGDRLDLQIFTASNGVALLDWRAAEHQVLTVWAHDSGVELRIGTGVYTLLPLTSDADLEQILDLVGQVVAGSWFETYAVDPQHGGIEMLAWRLGISGACTHGSPESARPRASGVRIHRRGQPWGPPRDP